MKTLKLIFPLLALTFILASCAPQALEDNEPNTLENPQATGEETSSDNGSKPF